MELVKGKKTEQGLTGTLTREEAARQLEQATELLAAAHARMEAGEYGLALQSYLKAEQLAPRVLSDHDYFNIGSLCYMQGDMGPVKGFLEKSLTAENKTNDWERWAAEYTLLEIYQHSNEKQKAYGLCREIEARADTGLVRMFLYGQVGSVYKCYREWERAALAFDMAIAAYKCADLQAEKSPSLEDYEAALAEILYRRSVVNRSLRHGVEARRDLILSAQSGSVAAREDCEREGIRWESTPVKL